MYEKAYRACDQIAESIEAKDGRFNLIQIKARLKERALKDETLLDVDGEIAGIVDKWDRRTRREDEESQPLFGFMPEARCALGDGFRVKMRNMTPVDFDSWFMEQQRVFFAQNKKHQTKFEYYSARKKAWEPRYKTLGDLEAAKFGFAEPAFA